MLLSKDKTSLKYKTFPSSLATRRRYSLTNLATALPYIGWTKIAKRSGHRQLPNNFEDEAYILYLIKHAVTVSLETAEIVNNLPTPDIIKTEMSAN